MEARPVCAVEALDSDASPARPRWMALGVRVLVYSDRPGQTLRLTLEALGADDPALGEQIHVALDWPLYEELPHVPVPGAHCRYHSFRDQRGYYAAMRALLDRLEPGPVCLLRQGTLLPAAALDALAESVVARRDYQAAGPLTNRQATAAFEPAPGEQIRALDQRLRLLHGPGASLDAPLLDADVLLLSAEARDCLTFPAFREDGGEQSLARYSRALRAKGMRLGLLLDAYAYCLPAPGRRGARTRAELLALLPEDERPALACELDACAAALAPRLSASRDTSPVITAPRTLCVLVASLQLRGGVIVLVNWINQLILRGLDVRVFVKHGHDQADPGLNLLFRPRPFADWDSMARRLPVGTAIVATFWTTARPAEALAWRVPGARGYYFIQDDETRFYDPNQTPEQRRLQEGARDSYGAPLLQVVTSRWIGEQLRAQGLDGGRAPVRIPVGIDLAQFYPLPRRLWRRREPVVLAMARPETPRRGYRLLVDALALLKRRRPEARIRLFGSADVRPESLPFACESLGPVAPADLRRLYAGADCFVDTSDFQGFGLCPLEAMSQGCACVLTASGGIDEYARDRVNALIVPHRASAVAEALGELITDLDLRRRLAVAAQRTVRDFDQARTVEGWLGLLAQTRLGDGGSGSPAPSEPAPVVVIVPIFNQLHAARRCIDSVLPTLGERHRLLLVDDHSDAHTAAELAAYAERHPRVHYLRNGVNLGFVGGANRGLAWAAARGAQAVLLNSDTIVVPGWIERLERAAQSAPDIGIVSPLSVASSHLWLRLAPGESFIAADRWLREHREPRYPEVMTPEGWCFFIKREVYQRLGGFDPVFGRGYCEESDYCMRALAAGFRLVVCDNLMIYHQGQVTFGAERSERYRHNRRIFDQRWAPIYQRLYRPFLQADPLGALRADHAAACGQPWAPAPEAPYPDLLAVLDDPALPERVRAHTQSLAQRAAAPLPESPAIVFVLPDLRPFGGTRSVVMLVNAWVLAGRHVRVVVLSHKGLPSDRLGLLVEPIFIDPAAPEALWPEADLMIGTLWITLFHLLPVAARRPAMRIGYFVQDFEVDFPDVCERGLREAVVLSYRLANVRFAKTPWICERVRALGFEMLEVPPALDTDVFYPRDRGERSAPTVAAMLRPGSRQRAPEVLIEVLRRVREALPGVRLWTFGCDEAEFRALGVDWIDRHHGVLDQAALSALYAEAQVFVDTSAFHGFGRVIAEAMACGLACVVTASGGVDAFAEPELNCLMAPPGDVEGLTRQTLRLLGDGALRARVAEAARGRMREFDPSRSAERTWALLVSHSASEVLHIGNGMAE